MSTEVELQSLGLYQKLLVIQQSVNGLRKNEKSNNYSYVTGTKVLGEIKPIMNKLGLILKQEVISIENVRMDYKTGVGTQWEKPKSEILSKVMMRFTWIDTATGDKDENLFGANGQNEWEKGLGSALTYAERYFLLKFFHIATDEDDIDNSSRKLAESKDNGVPVKTLEKQQKIKPELLADSPEFERAIDYIAGGGDIAIVETKYKLTEEVKNKLLNK